MTVQASANTLRFTAGICAAIFAFAFVAAPNSCEWGLAAYFWSGLAAETALFVLPLLARKDVSIGRRLALGFAFAAAGLAAWIAGLLAANVRIICRLF